MRCARTHIAEKEGGMMEFFINSHGTSFEQANTESVQVQLRDAACLLLLSCSVSLHLA